MNDSAANKKSTLPSRNTPKKRKKIAVSYLENAGAYYLERFAASEGQFRRVMTRKIDLSCREHPDQSREECLSLLETVIDKFRKLGYLNDEIYARGLLRSLQQRGYSRTRIMATLKSKGLATETIDPLEDALTSNQDRISAIRFMQRKKLGSFMLRERENAQQRDLASLARAGFSYDIASSVLSLSREEAEVALSDKDYTTD